MLTVTDIKELPAFSTIYILSILSLCVLAPALVFYYFESNLFLRLDIFKVIILTSGSGLLYFIACFWLSMAFLTVTIETRNVKTTVFHDLAVNSSAFAFMAMLVGYGAACGCVDIGWVTTVNQYCRVASIATAVTGFISSFFVKKSLRLDNT